MARRKGYADYYDYRLHGSGRTPPGAPLPPKGLRAMLRGHRGPMDMLRQVRSGTLLLLPEGLARAKERNKRGNFERIAVSTVDEAGQERTFVLRDLTEDELLQMIEEMEDEGAVFTFNEGYDLRAVT